MNTQILLLQSVIMIVIMTNCKSFTVIQPIQNSCVLPCLFSFRPGEGWDDALARLGKNSAEVDAEMYLEDGYSVYEHFANDDFKASITAIPEYADSVWDKPYFYSRFFLFPNKKTNTLHAFQWISWLLPYGNNSKKDFNTFQIAIRNLLPLQLFSDLGVPDTIEVSSVPFPNTEGEPMLTVEYNIELLYKVEGVSASYSGQAKYDKIYSFCFHSYDRVSIYVYDARERDFIIDTEKSAYTFDITEISTYTPAQLVKDFLEDGVDCFSIPRDTWKAEGG
jgi:hypothetical protein